MPLPSDQYRLQTDASGQGLGAVLSVVREEEEFPVAYNSHQLHDAEVHYSGTKLECLGVVASVKHFEIYLAGRSFKLVTDHQALTSLSSTRNLNRRLTRWSLFLQDLRYEAKYRPGSQNANANGLSRQCWRKENSPIKQLTDGEANILDEGDVAGQGHRQVQTAHSGGQ